MAAQHHPQLTLSTEGLTPAGFPNVSMVVVEVVDGVMSYVQTDTSDTDGAPLSSVNGTWNSTADTFRRHDFAFIDQTECHDPSGLYIERGAKNEMFSDSSRTSRTLDLQASQALFVRPRAVTRGVVQTAAEPTNTSASWYESHCNGDIARQCTTATTSRKYVQMRVSTFTLPFTFAEQQASKVRAEGTECMMYQRQPTLSLHLPDHNCDPFEWCDYSRSASFIDRGNWSSCDATASKQDDVYFVFSTSNWSTSTSGQMADPSWPAEFLAFFVAEEDVANVSAQMEAAFGEWAASRSTTSRALQSKLFALQAGGLFLDLKASADQAVTLVTSSCAGAGCADAKKRHISASLTTLSPRTMVPPDLRQVHAGSLAFTTIMPGSSGQQEYCAGCYEEGCYETATSLHADLRMQVTTGKNTYPIGVAFASFMSYCQTALALFAFLFPTQVTVAYLFRFGKMRSRLKRSVEILPNQDLLTRDCRQDPLLPVEHP